MEESKFLVLLAMSLFPPFWSVFGKKTEVVNNLYSVEQAKTSHVYSYRHGFKGFAAKLTEKQASEISSEAFT